MNIEIGVVGGNLQGAENEPYFSEFKSDFFQVQTVGILNISRYFVISQVKRMRN